MFKKTITTEFFTTLDLSLFFKSLFFTTFGLTRLRYGESIEYAEMQISSYISHNNPKVYSFYNGRSALFNTFKIIEIKKTDEVIVSAYTCVSVVNAVIQSGAKIVYVDIDKTRLGLSYTDLKRKINKNTKAIIVQHTFGKPASIEKIKKLSIENNIVLIEDCAHSLGSRINKIKLGNFGDFAIFSSGRDKVISSVNGGFLVINNKNYLEQAEKIYKETKMPSTCTTIKNHNYNIFGYIAKKTYDIFGLGKIIIFLLNKFGVITKILFKEEKLSNYKNLNLKLPNSLASLIENQIENIKILSTSRRSVAEFYDEKLKSDLVKPIFKKIKGEKNNYFRYPILTKSSEIREKLYRHLRLNNIILGNSWSEVNIVPIGSDLKLAKYEIGSCKNAENISSRILLLPTHKDISFKEANKIIELINNFKI